MRQRKIKNLDEKLSALVRLQIDEPAQYKGKWSEVFGNENPIYLEIGCGKGKFVAENALTYPDRNYIAVEGQASVALRALEKADAMELDNVRFMMQFIEDIRDYFADGELAGVYLNFSDPWPKERHAKRRLTYSKKMQQYMQVTDKENGFIQFKTDNEGLFEFTLDEIEKAGLKMAEMSRDLHNSIYNEKNITTEYEDKFSLTGKNINYVKIRA